MPTPFQRTKPFRVAALLLVLVAVLGWGVLRGRHRDARTRWVAPLTVSVVLVTEVPVPADTEAAWRRELSGLEDWFGREFERYRPRSPIVMVKVALDGVARVGQFPELPSATSVTERAGEALAFEQALDAIDAQLPPHGPRDLTIYVLLRPRADGGGQVEGVAEAGGRRGLVEGALDDGNVSLELTAVAHEALHCLGATDKYDAQGHAVEPGGLVAPEQSPRYPQALAEVMVGERAVGPGQGAPVQSLREVAVGPLTAHEVRWR